MRARRGFTLVETMIAALLLAVGILAVLGAERNARLLGESAGRRLRAVEAAASRLDSARAGCAGGVPALLTTVSADIPVGGTVAERAVHVETLAACGAP
jgi:prepilin-type N-terminal cleavage/methylation domain-containing protein